MKHQFSVTGAVLCILVMTGCTNETEGTEIQVDKQMKMTIQTSAETPQLCTDYTDDRSKTNFSWRSGDALSVVIDGATGNENCQLSTTQEGDKTSFSGNVNTFEGTKNIYVFYPYSTNTHTVNSSDDSTMATAKLTLPLTQIYTVGDAISNCFMVGVGTATADQNGITASINMKQVMSIIKLYIINAPGKVTGVKLKCEEAFATTATVNLKDATISNPGTFVNELAMTVTDNTIERDKLVTFAMFPTYSLNGRYITIEVTFNDGTTDIVRTMKKVSVDFERNTHYAVEFSGSDYIEINGIKVAVGNLVSNGPFAAKIGRGSDNGLYFQFGSLVGWRGGANFDGTGTGTSDANVSIALAPFIFNGSKKWVNYLNSIIWQGTTGVVPFTKPGSDSDDEKAGVGDPCRYYLGGTWRLPTSEEFNRIFNNSGWPTGCWSWTDSSALHTSGLRFPASGYCGGRIDAETNDVGSYGYYWSASPNSVINGYNLFFIKNDIYPIHYDDKWSGHPVRCIQE